MKISKALSLFVGSSLLIVSCWAQSAQPAQTAKPDMTLAGNIHTTDDPEVLRETQIAVDAHNHLALVWWVPFEFWAYSAKKRGNDPEKTRQNLKALKDYTVVGVFAANVSALGSFDYVTPADLQKKLFIRDSDGQEYAALTDISGDAKNLADLIRPMLGNAMGRAGENFAMLFFPAKTKTGKLIADEGTKGSFTVVLKDVLGETETDFAWHTPLTSFSEPRYCPAGKERVHADWDYCPWHGVKLQSTSAPVNVRASK